MAAGTSHDAMELVATHPTKMGQWISAAPEPDSDSIEILCENLSKYYKILKERRPDLRSYIPADDVDKFITPETVRACTGDLQGSWCPETHAHKIVQQAKKTFAILLLSGCENIAYDLLIAEGMTDCYLPLSCHGRIVVGTGPDGPKLFRSFQPKTLRQRHIDEFYAKQWLTLAPVFSDSLERLVLHAEQPVPVWDWQEIASGHYSKVVKSSLHPAHYKYSANNSSDNGNGKKTSETAEPRFIDVAIKQLNRKVDFEHEYSNLVKTRVLNNPHLIKHLAAYEVESASTPKGESKYYIIFPWADGGHLWTLWTEQNHTPRTPELILWSLQQMLGLATAIRDLHKGFEGPTHCRHGDLKPLNIFHFKKTASQQALGTLVIGDLGISKIRDTATSDRDEVTGTKATTPDYEPPEALVIARRNSRGEIQDGDAPGQGQKGRPWSRKYDMWSLGCIFLEFAIWLFHNTGALEGFASRRRAKAFYVTKVESAENGDPPDPALLLDLAQVCPMVKQAMDELRRDGRCRGDGTALRAAPLVRLVNLIEKHLLITEANARCDADYLVDELEEIVRTAKEDPVGHFGRMSAKPTLIPALFTPLFPLSAPRQGSGR